MPDRKRQHFVPKFYLRNFANSGSRAIATFNIASGRYFPQASIKTQAYRNNFYGADGEAEKQFGAIEASASRAIGAILRTGRPPARLGVDHHSLVYFVILQAARTVRSEADTNIRIDSIAKSLMRQQEPSADVLAALDKVKIVGKNAVIEAIRMAFLGAPVIYDLRPKLIENVSGAPFITSDHPVVLHNQLLEAVTNLNVTGYGASGLQIFLPISPDYALIFYDDRMYEVGSRVSNIARLTAPWQVEQLNAFQWFQASDNIYASLRSTQNELATACAAIAPLRRPTTEWVEEEVLQQSATRKRVKMRFRALPSPLKLSVPFIRLRGPPPATEGWDDVPMRDPDRVRWLEDLGEALTNGEISSETYSSLTSRVSIRRG